jgi:hypothetical protein
MRRQPTNDLARVLAIFDTGEPLSPQIVRLIEEARLLAYETAAMVARTHAGSTAESIANDILALIRNEARPTDAAHS